ICANERCGYPSWISSGLSPQPSLSSTTSITLTLVSSIQPRPRSSSTMFAVPEGNRGCGGVMARGLLSQKHPLPLQLAGGQLQTRVPLRAPTLKFLGVLADRPPQRLREVGPSEQCLTQSNCLVEVARLSPRAGRA